MISRPGLEAMIWSQILLMGSIFLGGVRGRGLLLSGCLGQLFDPCHHFGSLLSSFFLGDHLGPCLVPGSVLGGQLADDGLSLFFFYGLGHGLLGGRLAGSYGVVWKVCLDAIVQYKGPDRSGSPP